MRAAWPLQNSRFLKMCNFLTAEMHILAEEEMYRNLRHNPRFLYAHVHHLSDMHHYQRPKAFVFEAKVTVGTALKTREAHHWVEALNIKIKQNQNTGMLRAVKLSDIPAGASLINSTMALRKKPDKYCTRQDYVHVETVKGPGCIGALTYSVVHQIAIIDRMHVQIIDTVGAYLYQT